MKALITVITGQLGYDIKRTLEELGYTDIVAPTYLEMDITNEDQVASYILNNKPDIIYHCAAYTAVDKAEEEQEKCYNINVLGTRYIAKYANRVGAKLIYISTDYVFHGDKDGLYEPTDPINPVNYYGKTKYLGEQEVITNTSNYIITRISWVFGLNGNNFIKTMLRLATTHSELNVVSDQIGSPTYTKDLSKLLIKMSLSDKTGIYHVTNEGYCSWAEFAEYIFKEANLNVKVNPILTKDYKTTATRPLNSKMDKAKLLEDGFYKLPTWQDATKRYLEELNKEKEVENK